MANNKNKEKTEEVIKNIIYAQLGIATELSDKFAEKMDEYVEKGKKVAKENRDLDEEIKRTIDRAKDKKTKTKKQNEQ